MEKDRGKKQIDRERVKEIDRKEKRLFYIDIKSYGTIERLEQRQSEGEREKSSVCVREREKQTEKDRGIEKG